MNMALGRAILRFCDATIEHNYSPSEEKKKKIWYHHDMISFKLDE